MKRKLLFAIVALLCSVGSWAQPTASTPSVGNTYYLYNPMTKLFMTSSVNLPFVRPIGSAWKLEAAAGHDGWVTLRLKDNDTEGCGYFWGKWWANDPAGNSDSYSDERVYQLVNISANNYKLKSYAWGATDAYIYINKGNEGDRSFRLACNSQDQGGLDEGYITWQFISEEDYASYMENDYTSQIKNNDFTSGLGNWTVVATKGNRQAHGNTAVEYWNSTAAGGGFDYYQELTGLPAGKYVLRAAMYNSTNSESGATFDTNGQCGVYGTSNGTTKYSNVTVDGTAYNIYTTEGLLVPDGNLRLGLKNSTTMTARWFGADWIQLSCVEYCLSVKAIALPGNGAMEADTWYYYDIPTNDDYEFTSTNATTLTYSEDGAQLFSEATGTEEVFTAAQKKEISLSAGRLYVKANAATTLTVSYKYNIGTASADKAYIQPGQTVTVSYTVSTNDPGATLTQDYSGVTFNDAAISVTPTASGFTFTVPAVTENAEYTLAIPTGAIKYNEDNKNAAQNITLNTPALFDGIYFLKAAATYDGSSEGTSAAVGKYLARGMNYGTHATLDKYGLPLQITTDANNATSIQAFDTKRYFFHGNTYDCYADQASLAATGYFTVSLNNGKLLIHNNTMAAGTYLKYNTSAAGDANIAVFDDGNGTNSGPIIMWTTESPAEHATVMQTLKDTQAAAAAAAAYASGNYASLNGISTVAALEAELTANYIEGVFVAPSSIESISEKYQGNQPGSGNVTETVYSNTINITEPGFYKFSMQAFYRAGSNEVTQAMHTAGIDFPPVVLFFGDSETQIKSIYDEGGLDQGIAEGYYETETVGGAPVQYNSKWYTNGQHNSVIIFQKDYYHNDVWFYASEPGVYSYGVKYMGWACANMQWFIYSPESVTITSYAAAADAADYTALANAISAYDAATWGFENGEYAPYNNAEAIANIAAARAINSSETNSKLLVNSLTADLALTQNVADVDAIYNGMFATAAAGQNYPDGWTRTNAWGQMQSGISGDFATAYYNQPGSLQYGNQGVYTMPLADNQAYKLTFSYRSQEDNSNTGVTASVLNGDDEGLAAKVFPGNGSTSEWKTVSAGFTTGDAGDYVLTLANGGNTWITGVSLVKTQSATANMKVKANKFGTFIAPFDVTIPTGIKAYTIESISGSKLNLTEVETTISANTPVILENTTGAEYDENIVGYFDSAEDIYTANYLTGVYTNAVVPVNSYVLQTQNGYQAFYKVTESGKMSAANRCYLTLPAESTVKAFYLNFSDETAINAVEATQNENAAIFNLAGQRVSKAQKGLYIVNGKKVTVK